VNGNPPAIACVDGLPSYPTASSHLVFETQKNKEVWQVSFDKLLKNIQNFQDQGETLLNEIQLPEDKAGDSQNQLHQYVNSLKEHVLRAKEQASEVIRLRKFLSVVSLHNVEKEFEKHKEVLMGLMQSKKTPSDYSKPYILFLLYLENPESDYSEDDFNCIEDFFGRNISRALYQEKFKLEETDSEPVVTNTQEPSAEENADHSSLNQPDNIDLNFTTSPGTSAKQISLTDSSDDVDFPLKDSYSELSDDHEIVKHIDANGDAIDQLECLMKPENGHART